MSSLQFSERQRAIIAAAVTMLGVVAILWVAGQCLLLVGRFLSFFSGVLLPLATAGLAAMILRPYYDWLLRRVRFPSVAATLVFVSVLVPVGAFVVLFGSLVAQQLSGLLSKFPVWSDQIRVEIQQRLPGVLQFWREHQVGSRLREAFGGGGGSLAKVLTDLGGGALSAGAELFRTLAGLLGWVVMPVYLVFFLISEPLKGVKPENLLPFLKPDTRRDLVFLAREFVSVIVTFFRGQFVVSTLQGILYAVGFLAVGLQFGIVIGFFMGLMNMIPYLGSMMGLLIALPTALYQDGGGVEQLLWVVGVIVIVQCIEGYYLTPKIMGDRTGLHPMAIIFAIFFWGTALGGVLGMILAIPLTAFLVVFWRLLKAKYIKELV